ncbi:DNA repair protein RecO [Chitinophaga caeni]|uniref:DNA repair protein RecO n=1 Tax=Chitinophaga caeni TaxID=2029983 RepID=A0A291QS84_9BACT|nr:DNA repair protein RecO [Chitinophaga caeni]ATL46858.1 DNA repair protein RecO [Chitinophaga caeni]
MLHKTPGIVLRTVKYGEASVIVSVFTELFGLQSYIVNGARSGKPKSAKGNLLQPGNILDLVVYHQEQKNIQRISEFKLAYIYTNLHVNIVKNTVALYMVELLQKSLKQPESQPSLYYFVSNSLQLLDQANANTAANIPLYFTLKLASHLGFGINGHFSNYSPFLDMQEGTFTDLPPHHSHHLDALHSEITDRFLRVQTTVELEGISLNKDRRRILLYRYLDFFKLHMPDFTELHSPPILHEILDA